ncbi:stabilizer of axonemal microtubules 1-like [Anneissia japonica]|uniref:stabilizer of axonemal microtubules 1-like n=1 Tax=Anneissia japonica TaxID=1529436 RepID=UPI0014258B72|nr:stabilizer of axonemal microtubules 1-like [Anneissia japonica]
MDSLYSSFLCACRRHRCSHEKLSKQVLKNPLVKGICNLSEYQHAYKSWPWQPPRESMRTTINKSTTVPSVGTELATTYQKTYVQHKTNRLDKKSRAIYQPPATKLNVVSTYDIDFTEKKAVPAQSFKPKEKKVAFSKPFEHTSVTQATYTPFDRDEIDYCKTVANKPEENLKTGSKETFTATTTVQDDFRQHENVSPAKSMRPIEKPLASKEPFTAETIHHAEFTPKTTEPAVMVKPQEQLTKGQKSSPFDGQTTFRRDFPEHKNHKREQSYKPRALYVENETKFDGQTTQRSAYKAWAVQPKAYVPWAEKNKTGPYIKSKFMNVTSYQNDYKNPEILMTLSKCRGEPCRYDDNLGAGEPVPFEDSTQYKMSFVAWENAKPATSYKIVQEYKIPTTPLMGKSVFQSQFLGAPAKPAKSCRPDPRPRTSSGMLSMKTTYNTTYQGKRPHSCPAQRLGENDSDYKHVKDGATGHKFYIQTSKN